MNFKPTVALIWSDCFTYCSTTLLTRDLDKDDLKVCLPVYPWWQEIFLNHANSVTAITSLSVTNPDTLIRLLHLGDQDWITLSIVWANKGNFSCSSKQRPWHHITWRRERTFQSQFPSSKPIQYQLSKLSWNRNGIIEWKLRKYVDTFGHPLRRLFFSLWSKLWAEMTQGSTPLWGHSVRHALFRVLVTKGSWKCRFVPKASNSTGCELGR